MLGKGDWGALTTGPECPSGTAWHASCLAQGAWEGGLGGTHHGPGVSLGHRLVAGVSHNLPPGHAAPEHNRQLSEAGGGAAQSVTNMLLSAVRTPSECYKYVTISCPRRGTEQQ
eukprot:6633600-Pyramimonas_sp.AAC.1